MEYEGYANFPTFVVARMILDDAALLDECRAIVLGVSDFFPRMELKAYIETTYFDGPANYANDLLDYALSMVDWQEVAETIGAE